MKLLYQLALLISLGSAALLAQGCAKATNPLANKGTGSGTSAKPIPPANVTPATFTAPGTSQTAQAVATVALYYLNYSVNSPDKYSAMLADDGGCQMAKDFTTAIGSGDLAGSTLAYCNPGQPGAAADCVRAKGDAQQILALIASLNTLCADGGPDNPYIYGDVQTANDLLIEGGLFRSDLGLVNPR